MVYKVSFIILGICNILDFGVRVSPHKFDREEMAMWLKLTLVHGIGPKRLLRLFSHFESIGGLFDASGEKLLRTGILTSGMIEGMGRLKSASDENYLCVIDSCAEKGILMLPLIDERYPKRLLGTGSPPCTLFLWGDASLLDAPKTFAIVGSRVANEAAHKFAYSVAGKLGNAGFAIVSGGASGIDTEAHKGALDSGARTMCVMGAGFFNFYPGENRGLFETIREKGLLISEHLPNFHGDRISFLQRNRITSGLSDGLLFCASESLKSGTATQVKTAHSQKIPIFCPDIEVGVSPYTGVRDAMARCGALPVRGADEIINALNEGKTAMYAQLQNH